MVTLSRSHENHKGLLRVVNLVTRIKSDWKLCVTSIGEAYPIKKS